MLTAVIVSSFAFALVVQESAPPMPGASVSPSCGGLMERFTAISSVLDKAAASAAKPGMNAKGARFETRDETPARR